MYNGPDEGRIDGPACEVPRRPVQKLNVPVAIISTIVRKSRRLRSGGSSGSDRMTEDENAAKPAPKQTGPQFIPKLKGKKVAIRVVSGGQPVTGIVEGYNAYEILIQTAKGPILVFKRSIATMEPLNEWGRKGKAVW